MDQAQFDAVFGQFPHPVLLHTGNSWLQNPAALDLELSDSECGLLERAEGPDASIWLQNLFYYVTVSPIEGGTYYVLHQDLFFPSAGSNLSGQLRRPLSYALNDLEIAEKHLDDASKDVPRRRMVQINHSLHRIFRVLDQLDDLSMPLSDLCTLIDMDLSDYMHNFYQRVLTLTRDLPVQIELERDEGVAPIMGDADRLSVLFEHLLSNAIKAVSPQGGKITISFRLRRGHAIVSFSDTGPGLSADVLTAPLWSQPNALLFGRGTGLGFPIVQRIAAAHNATLVTNTAPESARVAVSFPIYPPRDIVMRSPPLPDDIRYGGYSKDLVTLADVLPTSCYTLSEESN